MPSNADDVSTHRNDNHKVRPELIPALFAQPFVVFCTNFSFITIYSLWLFKEVNKSHLFAWYASCIFIFLCRSTLHYVYLNKPYKLQQQQWMRIWSILTVLLSLAYAYMFIIFTPLDKPEYQVMVLAALAMCTATTVVGYASSMHGIYCYIGPYSLLTAIYFLSLDSFLSNVVGISIIGFSVVIVVLMLEVSKVFISAVELNYENKLEIEKRNVVEKQLFKISRIDALTGLYNRRYFDEIIDHEIARASRSESALTLMIIDIDFFKDYNDYYGHIAGDKCLQQVSELLQSQITREGDVLSRYGGEEFTVILPYTNNARAIEFAIKLHDFVQAQQIPHLASKLESEKVLTVSIGVVSVCPNPHTKASLLIQRADEALYRVKQNGRNHALLYIDLPDELSELAKASS